MLGLTNLKHIKRLRDKYTKYKRKTSPTNSN